MGRCDYNSESNVHISMMLQSDDGQNICVRIPIIGHRWVSETHAHFYYKCKYQNSLWSILLNKAMLEYCGVEISLIRIPKGTPSFPQMLH